MQCLERRAVRVALLSLASLALAACSDDAPAPPKQESTATRLASVCRQLRARPPAEVRSLVLSAAKTDRASVALVVRLVLFEVPEPGSLPADERGPLARFRALLDDAAHVGLAPLRAPRAQRVVRELEQWQHDHCA